MKRWDKDQLMEGEWSHKYKKLNSFLRESNLSDSAVMEWRFIRPRALVVAPSPYQLNDKGTLTLPLINLHVVAKVYSRQGIKAQELFRYQPNHINATIRTEKCSLSTSLFKSNKYIIVVHKQPLPLWGWEKQHDEITTITCNNNTPIHDIKGTNGL